MAFDGIGYRDLSLGYPTLYHPHAPLIGRSYGNALWIAYCRAQNYGRMLIDQHYVLDFRTLKTGSSGVEFTKNAYARIAEGFRWLPPETTHLVAEIMFAIRDVPENAVARHRVSVKAGANTDNGTQLEQRISQAVRNTPIGISDYSNPINQYVARVDVALSTVTTAQDVEIFVEAYAIKSGTSDGVRYFPQHVGVWAEIR